MAEEYQGGICGGNWWSSASRHALVAASPCSVGFNDHMGSFGCPNDMVDMIKSRSSCGGEITINSSSDQDHVQNPHENSDISASTDSNLQMIGFGLNSSSSTLPSDLNQALLLRSSSGRAESNFHNAMLQDDMGSFKQPMNNQDFSLDQSSSSSGFPITSSSANNSYGGGFPSQLLQSLYDSEEVVVPQPQLQSLFNNGSSSMSYSSAENYGTISSNDLLSSPTSSTTCWPRYSPSCLRPSLQPRQQQQQQQSSGGGVGGGLHFSNINTPFWNAPAAALSHDIRSTGLFSSLSQSQYTAPIAAIYDEHKPINSNNFTKPNTNEDAQDSSSSTVKKSGSNFCSSTEPVFKRARIETPSPLPTFKVRKEKLGDRITALQQLVSPFGKTDTASVLHEAIEYIKFLHDQVSVLSTPYMKNGGPMQHQQGCEKMEVEQGGKQDLKSRGLCLVPISSTFPVANETTADFWTPTFGATSFR